MLKNHLHIHLRLLQKEQLKKNKKQKQKTEPTSDLMRNKITDRITKVSKTSPQNNSEENIEHDREIHRERYIFPEQRQKIIDDLRLM